MVRCWPHQPGPRDHPREYGENAQLVQHLVSTAGPSPRIRGKYALTSPPFAATRTIPANTGKMLARYSLLLIFWDHPREYGENRFCSPHAIQHLGPSPRIRGKSVQAPQPNPSRRTIPANTGKIRRQDTTSVIDPDHPREYGEN